LGPNASCPHASHVARLGYAMRAERRFGECRAEATPRGKTSILTRLPYRPTLWVNRRRDCRVKLKAAATRDHRERGGRFLQHSTHCLHPEALHRFGGVVRVFRTKNRAKLRGLMPTFSASRSTDKSPTRLSRIYFCRSPKMRSAVCAASNALNCDCPPGRLRKATS